MRRVLASAGCSALALAVPQIAWAQEASSEAQASSAGGIVDIVVTAQRRSESVQKSSVSIEVLSAEAVAKAGITQARDIGAIMPGVQIGQGGAATQIYIRGVGDFGSTALTNPAVAFNVDGVYVSRPAGVEGNFFDIERVEVLKGPQGTLYGRNATGGAINVITKKPRLGVNEMAGAIEVGNYSKILAEAAVNLPVGEIAAVRIAGQVVDRGSYTGFRYNDDVHQSIRGQLLVEPTDRLTLRLAADYTHIGGGGADYVPLPRIPGVSPWTSVVDPRVTAVFDQQSVAAGFCAPVGLPGSPGGLSTYQGACQPLTIPGLGTFPQNSLQRPATGEAGKTDNVLYSFSGQLDYDLGNGLALTLLPAFRSASFDYLVHPGLGGYNNAPDGEDETSETTTLEARLSFESDKLKAVIGGYYFNEQQEGMFNVYFGLIQDFIQSQDINSRSYAGFGQATYSITPEFRIIGGLRYTYDKRKTNYKSFDLAASPQNPDGGLGFLGAVAAGCTPSVVPGLKTYIGCQTANYGGTSKVSKVNWKVGAEFDVGPQNMLYATASTGLKAGGVSSGQISPGVPFTYKPEDLLAFEVGSRNRFFENAVQVNLEAFYYDYKNHQEALIGLDGVGVPNQIVVNAGKGRAYGANVDLVFMPTPNDRLRFGAEYLNTRYTQFVYSSQYLATTGPFVQPVGTGCLLTNDTVNLVQTIDCTGKPFTRAPKWTGVVSYAHTFELAQGSSLEVSGDMQFLSGRFLGTDYTANSHVGSNQTFNAAITYAAAGGNWSLMGYIRNISNEAVYTSTNRANFTQTFVTASINPPRTFGARLNFNF